jgi:hypothetical protein
MVTRLNGIATPFGPLHMDLKVDERGKAAKVSVKPLARNCSAVVVHVPGGDVQRLEPQRGGSISFPVR